MSGLLRAKLTGHAHVARTVLDDEHAAETLASKAAALDDIKNLEEARAIEAVSAQTHFAAWPRNDALRFVRKDLARVPDHWRRFDGRRSVLRGGNANQRAAQPLNALLSFCYRLAEIEAHRAIVAVGLDPGMGLLHADYPSRHSLVLDLMETLRPQVDCYVLHLVSERVFRKSAFAELSDGHVRLLPPLSHELAETLPTWGQLVAPFAEMVTHSFSDLAPGRIVKRTPLTGSRRRNAQSGVRPAPVRSPKAPVPISVCEGCGIPVSRRGYLWCEACRPAVKREAAAKARKAQSGAREERRKARVPDPSSTREARARLGQTIGRQNAEALAWQAAHPDLVVDRAASLRFR